jgi:hypothetical protein
MRSVVWLVKLNREKPLMLLPDLFYAQQLQPQVQPVPGQLSPQLQVVVCDDAHPHPHSLPVVSIFKSFCL